MIAGLLLPDNVVIPYSSKEKSLRVEVAERRHFLKGIYDSAHKSLDAMQLYNAHYCLVLLIRYQTEVYRAA